MFKNRQEAGWLLAQRLFVYKGQKTLVLGLTRGGAVVAYEVAKALGASWDILVIKKIGAPGNEELAIGAVGPDKVVVWDEELCQRLGVDEKVKSEKLKVKNEQRQETERLLRDGRPPQNLQGENVILVDDGIATGTTVEVAVKWVKSRNPLKIILAVPVAPPEAVEKLKSLIHEIICLRVEPSFWAVGQFYKEFDQVRDEEIIKILKEKEIL